MTLHLVLMLLKKQTHDGQMVYHPIRESFQRTCKIWTLLTVKKTLKLNLSGQHASTITLAAPLRISKIRTDNLFIRKWNKSGMLRKIRGVSTLSSLESKPQLSRNNHGKSKTSKKLSNLIPRKRKEMKRRQPRGL